MRSNVDEDRPSLLLGYLTPFLASVVVLAGLIVLAEWLTNSFHVANFSASFVPMAPSTGLFLTLVGIAILLRRRQKAPAALWVSSRVVLALVLGLAALIALQPFINAGAGWSLDIERLLVASSASGQGFVAGRMSPVTAFLFVLVSLAVLVLPRSGYTASWRRVTANALSVCVLSAALVVIVGYWRGLPQLYGSETVPVALPTAIAFLLVALALLSDGPDDLLYRLIHSRSVFAQVCRMAIPATIIPILVGEWVEETAFAGAPASSQPALHTAIALGTAAAVALAMLAVARRIQSGVDRDVTKRERAQEALAESEKRYRGLFEHMIEGFAYCRMIFENGEPQDFVYLAVNEVFETLTGLTGVTGKRVTEVIPGIRESDPKLFEIYGRVALTGKPEQFEIFVEALKMWFSISLYSPEKEFFVAVFDVITGRKRDEERIKRLNTVLLAIRNVNQLITQQRDCDQLIKGVCQTIVSTRGYQASWLVLLDGFQKPLITAEVGFGGDFVKMMEDWKQGKEPSCIHAALALHGTATMRNTELECSGCSMHHAMKGSSTITVSLEHRWKVYGVLTASVPAHMEPDVEERKLFEEVAQDVALALDSIRLDTEKRLAEEALERSEENFRNSLDDSALGIRIINAEGGLLYANKAMLDIYGYSTVDELRQTPVSQRYTPESYAAHLERKDKRKRGEHVPDRYEINIVRKDGETRCLEVIRSEVVWNGKKEFQTIYLDITERRQMEEKLIISDRLASIGELASGVAHELNNPLTSVFGYSELLLQRDLPDDVKEHLGIIHSQTERAAQIVKNLLTFARSHALKKQPTDINQAIQGVLALRRYKQMESNIEAKTQFAANLPEVTADGFQLQQVFMNIVTNAEYFMAQAHGRGVLTITTGEVDGLVRCSFADDGLGISPENMRRLFTPFFTTKEIGKGTGLGMSISHGIVSEHQGRIYARSKTGEGATFIVELPINPDKEGASR